MTHTDRSEPESGLVEELRSLSTQLLPLAGPAGEAWDVPNRAADALDAKDRELAEARESLEQCEAYFDNRADADCQGDPGEFVPNKEMVLLTSVRGALGKIGGRYD